MWRIHKDGYSEGVKQCQCLFVIHVGVLKIQLAVFIGAENQEIQRYVQNVILN
jgi:hypothetical protein